MDDRRVWIYGLIDPRDNEIKYVGKTFRLERRLRDHLSDNRNNLKTSWIKNLKKDGLIPELFILDETNIKNCDSLEIYWICQMKCWGFKLKNMTNGGDGSYGVTPWNKGKIGEFHHTEESKKKMSADRRGKPGLKGRKLSDDTKKKMSESRRKRGSIEYKKSDKKNHKKVYCYDLEGILIKIYKSMKDTAEDGFNTNDVSKVCRKKHKIHKNHIFSFCEITDFIKIDYERIVWNKDKKGLYKHTEKTLEKLRKPKKIIKIIDRNGGKNSNSKKLYTYDLNLNFIKDYECVKDSMKDGFCYGTVKKRCQTKSLKPHKGIIFSFDNLIYK